MIHHDSDDPIDVISVDSVGLLDAERTPEVDDIVIRFESGLTLYVQVKKNQTDRRAWSLSELREELRSARNQLERDEAGCVSFYSRDQFGKVQKLANACRIHSSNHRVFEEEASEDLSNVLDELSDLFERTKTKTFELVKRIDFKVTEDLEGIEQTLIRSLRRVVSDPETALYALRDLLTKHTAGRARTPLHEIEREHVLQTLQDAGAGLEPESRRRSVSRIIAHGEKIRILQEKSKEDNTEAFLHGSELEFVWPEERKDYHPDRILERLSAPAQNGVLLVGPGGIGKSRILLETARRAHEQLEEWDVFHARNTDSIDNDQLYDISKRSDDALHTLVVVDEVIGGLNHHDIEQNLIPELNKELVILASARPADLQKLERRDLELFAGGIVEMYFENVSQEFSSRISARIREEVAPTALRDLGDDQVALLCGNRPAIALHIARKLEQRTREKYRVGKGGLSQEDLEDIRPGELIDWLERRFEEDKLELKREESGVGRPVVGPKILTSAAVLAAAPAEQNRLVAVAANVLSERVSAPVADGKYIVETILKARGWLVPQKLGWQGDIPNAQGLAVPHDVVTDELLDKIFREHTGYPEEQLERLLSACADDLVIWSNMTKCLGRLLDRIEGDQNRSARLAKRLKDKAEEWLSENAPKMAEKFFSSQRTMSIGEKYTTSHALSTALDAGFWPDEVAVRELGLPWLEQYGREYKYASILFQKVLHIGAGRETVSDSALDWYDNYDYMPAATYVFRAAVSQLTGSGKQSERAVALGVRWLKRYGKTTWRGQFILTALLEWDKKHRVHTLADFCLQWLDKFGLHYRAQYVIYTLLKQVDLKALDLEGSGDAFERAESYAFDWLDEHQLKVEAQRIISVLFENYSDIGRIPKKAARSASMWLSDNVPSPESRNPSEYDYPVKARFVLHAVLRAIENNHEGSALLSDGDPIDKSLLWLEEHLDADGTEYVIGPLLGVTRVDNEDSFADALEYSFQWLEDYGDKKCAQRVYTAILRHPDIEDDPKSRIAKSACEWLDQHTSAGDRDFVINSLFQNWKVVPSTDWQTPGQEDVIDAALNLGHEVSRNEQEAAFSAEAAKEALINLIHAEPDTAHAEDAKRLLSELGYDVEREIYRSKFEERSTTIGNALDRAIGFEKRKELLQEGADWLCDARTYQYQCDGWQHLMKNVLAYEDHDIDQKRVIDAIRREVCHRQSSQDKRWSFAYQELIKRSDNPINDELLTKTGLNWIKFEGNFQHDAWRFMLNSMLKHYAEDPDLRKRIIRIGKIWLKSEGEEQRSHWGDVYELILNNKELTEDERKNIFKIAINFLKERREHGQWEKVYKTTEKYIRDLNSGTDKYKNMLSNAAVSPEM
jgi:hypothetical protein